MFRRLIAGSLAVLMLLSCSAAAGATTTASNDLTANVALGNPADAEAFGYREYQSANADGSLAKNDIEIKEEGDGAELYLPGDSVTLEFTVDEAGWYEPHITYRALLGTGGDILFSLLLDGQLPYAQMSNLRLNRLWKNATEEFQTDEDGNQFSPEQEEVFDWQTAKLYDSEGFIIEPLRLYLSKGTHTLTVLLSSECVKIGSVTLARPEVLPTYEEYAKQYQGAAYQGETLVYEGERADLKSQRMYIPMSNRNDADVQPADPFKKLNNYIGGTNWNGDGGAITWNVHAPADGWYQLGFHFRQTYLQESNSYRTLLIDGEIPFAQAQGVPFG
jgi:hypothetical protein